MRKVGSKTMPFCETYRRKHDDDKPAFFRAIPGQCSRPKVILEFFTNVIEMPHGWTNVVHHSIS